MKKIIFFICLFFIFTIDVCALKIEERWVNTESQKYLNREFLSYQKIITFENKYILVGSLYNQQGNIISIYNNDGTLENSIKSPVDSINPLIYDNQFTFYESISSFQEESAIYTMDLNGNISESGKGTLSTSSKIYSVNNKIFIVSRDNLHSDNKVIIREIDSKFNIKNEYSYIIPDDVCETKDNCLSYIYIKNENIYLLKKGIDYENETTEYSIVKFDTQNYTFNYNEKFELSNKYNVSVLNENLLLIGIYSSYEYNQFSELYFYNFKNQKISLIFEDNISIKGHYYDGEYYYVSGYDDNGALLYKFDENLDLKWEYRLNEEDTSFKSMTIIDNNIYILKQSTKYDNGFDRHNNGFSHRNEIFVIDSDSALIQKYEISNDELTNSEFHIIMETNNGFLIAGEKLIDRDIAHGVIAEYTIIHDIETKTDGNGTVEADHIEAEGGAAIKFTVTPKEGYVLSVVKVTDSNGNVVTFTDYTFTMPNANVLIEATFVPIKEESNPETTDKIIFTLIATITLGFLLLHNNRRRNILN